ncbi:alpha/beta hydrolase [Curtobacterium sp. PhB136]|uniref:alpha/beta hydrolase n=1 Tax=Curtobacterium sp. PhB136 TaxID=2485181 RepID=UPI0010507EDF|nr:alpha/beta hydrolase [Curtobacterium sp. PhB136]TCK65740.1 esterase/lipase superfamily enzyme [Curtobacterium sp. PhB136]
MAAARFRAYERDFRRLDAPRRLRDIAAASGLPRLTLEESKALAGLIAVTAGLADSIATSAMRNRGDSWTQVTSTLDGLWSEQLEDPLGAQLSDVVSVAVITLGMALGDPRDPAPSGRSAFARAMREARAGLYEGATFNWRGTAALGQQVAEDAKWRSAIEMERSPKFRRLLEELAQLQDVGLPELLPIPSDRVRDSANRLLAESPAVKLARFNDRRTGGRGGRSAGAGSVQAPPQPPNNQLWNRQATEVDNGDRRVKVHFGTDREALPMSSMHFDASRAVNGVTRYGIASVFVPESHHVGKLGYKAIIAPNRFARSGALQLQNVTELTISEFADALRAEVAAVTTRRILLSIHGFSTTFNAAMLKTAQLAADLDLDAVVAAFSWPSAGSLLRYGRDRTEALASAPGLAAFLLFLAQNSGGVRHVDIVVHSMGNYVLVNAVAALQTALKTAGLRLGHVFLAAPDIDAAEFATLASTRKGISRSGTMYASRNDLALLISTLNHRAPRAGRFPPVPTQKGIHKVDVSAVNLPLIGHGYHAQTAAVIADIADVILHNTKPGRRRRLRPSSTGAYWIMRA